jgi:hypothetical protein
MTTQRQHLKQLRAQLQAARPNVVPTTKKEAQQRNAYIRAGLRAGKTPYEIAMESVSSTLPEAINNG